jgi:tetratricopeptide (TPR) repeat protein
MSKIQRFCVGALLGLTLLVPPAGCGNEEAKHKAAGNILFGQKKYAEAKAEFEKAIAVAPKDPNGYILLGNALFELADYAGARAAYEKALALDPKAMEAHRAIAILALRQGEPGDRTAYDDFLRHMQHVIDENPRDRNALRSAGQILSDGADPADRVSYMEKQKKAEAWLRDALKLDDRDPKTLFALAVVYARKGDVGTALRVVERLGSVSSNATFPPYAEAVVHTIAGDREKALDSVERLLKLDAIDPETLKNEPLLQPLIGEARFQTLVADAVGRQKGMK